MSFASNKVFIARSLDGFIADPEGKLDWLEMIPNPDQKDLGYAAFMKGIDAIVMGRGTYEVVCGFGIPWPYEVPVFVLSRRLSKLREAHEGRVKLISGSPAEVVEEMHLQGFMNLYIDGGITIQRFLEADLIDELIISTLPVLLGGGKPLFGALGSRRAFEHVSSTLLLGEIVQDHYRRIRP